MALGRRDAFELTLAPEIGRELGEHTEHIEEGLARCGASIDRLFGGFQRDPEPSQLMDEVLQVPDAARQAIDPRHHESVSMPEKSSRT
jgi:hypothetical protein